jgi:hypothetical protein
VAGCCEYGSDPSGSTECVAEELLGSQEGLCSMELEFSNTITHFRTTDRSLVCT